jgi:uncharacterized membrane protein
LNAAQIHLLFNHWPFFLIVVAFFILLVGEIRNNMTFKQLGLLFLILAALFAIPTQFSGGGAEQILMDQNLADHDRIEKHESLGFWSAMLAYGLGIFSFISLLMVFNIHPFFSYLRKLIILVSGGAIILFAIAAHSGGEIRHTEIRKVQSL